MTENKGKLFSSFCNREQAHTDRQLPRWEMSTSYVMVFKDFNGWFQEFLQDVPKGPLFARSPRGQLIHRHSFREYYRTSIRKAFLPTCKGRVVVLSFVYCSKWNYKKRGLDMTKFRKLLPLAFHQVLQIVIFGK